MRAESALHKLQQHLLESKRIYSRSTSLRTSIYRFSSVSIIVLAAFAFSLYLLGDVWLSVEVFFWTLAAIIAFTALVFMNLALLRNREGAMEQNFRAANKLTAIRLFAAPVVFILLFRGRVIMGSIIYVIAIITDVIDGYLARKLGQGTTMGIMLDPIGDIFLTLALFLFLWLEGAVPLWLFAILVARYGQFFVGLIALAIMDAVPQMEATLAGKVVGVIQALGIIILMAETVFGVRWPSERFNMYVFVVLGTGFSSVIVSQTIIGWRALQMARR
jgi:phosphatidylglycerophosphate synthase